MKNYSLIIVLLISVYRIGYSQITVSGIGSGINIGTYNPEPNALPSSFTYDAGSQIYRKINSVGGGAFVYQYIFRQNNIWKHGVFAVGVGFPANNEFVNFETVQACSQPNPPCTMLWKESTGAQYNVNITGSSCSTLCTFGTSFEAQPNFIRLPVSVTTLIVQIANPKNGMMVYDATTNTVKVYSNGTWKSLNYQ